MNKLNQFICISIVASAFTVWLYLVTQVQPNKGSIVVLCLFFASLVVWLGSLFAWLLFMWKVKQGNSEVIYAHIKPSVRQGFLLAGTASVLLFLQLLRVLSVWDVVLVLFVALIFEVAAQQSPAVRKT